MQTKFSWWATSAFWSANEPEKSDGSRNSWNPRRYTGEGNFASSALDEGASSYSLSNFKDT